MENMEILITRSFIDNLIIEQLKKAKTILENSYYTAIEKKEIIEDMFFSSDDIADRIETMIKENEAHLSDDLDLVTIQQMRADALADVLTNIE